MPSSYENNCGWTLEHIEPYLDEELKPEELERFEQHVARCDSCARELDFATRVVGELRSLPSFSAPEGVLEGIGERTAPSPTLAERLNAWLGEWWGMARRPAMATMIVLVAVVGVFVITQREVPTTGDEVSQQEIEQAAEQAMIAFAYIGKYGRQANYIIRDEIEENLVERVEEAMEQSVEETIKHTRILETKKRDKRSDT